MPEEPPTAEELDPTIRTYAELLLALAENEDGTWASEKEEVDCFSLVDFQAVLLGLINTAKDDEPIYDERYDKVIAFQARYDRLAEEQEFRQTDTLEAD